MYNVQYESTHHEIAITSINNGYSYDLNIYGMFDNFRNASITYITMLGFYPDEITATEIDIESNFILFQNILAGNFKYLFKKNSSAIFSKKKVYLEVYNEDTILLSYKCNSQIKTIRALQKCGYTIS